MKRKMLQQNNYLLMNVSVDLVTCFETCKLLLIATLKSESAEIRHVDVFTINSSPLE